MEDNQIPPKSEWKNLNSIQLYDIKSQLMSKYFDLKSINASFSNQYLKFIYEVDALISLIEQKNQPD